ncbi:hypothetical protein [Terrihalobacillus insolitus]|uniref:hypothetical protein n=1 Tax=Terrihalobacillus insolitus TaxID=2950438 RepID=UPI00234222CC|nr:hypothetical protein [Terrihalobacillus insolitus]MDC3413927.1 hypothetical protein [Terrihalobacillus insolitus]
MAQDENYVDFELIPSVEGECEDNKVEIQFVSTENEPEDSDKIIFQLVTERDKARSEIETLKEENDKLRNQMKQLQETLNNVMISNNVLFNKLNEIQSILDQKTTVPMS